MTRPKGTVPITFRRPRSSCPAVQSAPLLPSHRRTLAFRVPNDQVNDPVGRSGKAPRLVITCYVRYTIDPRQLDAFEAYARAWIPLVNSMGGTHHGYFLPEEGNNVAVALFSFPSLADFETYGRKRKNDPRCKAAFASGNTKCILHYEWQLMRPILPEAI